MYCLNLKAQNTSFEMDVVSNYIWRDGRNDFPAIQPTIDYDFPQSGLAMYLWASFNFSDDYVPVETTTSLYYTWVLKDTSFVSFGLNHYSGERDSIPFYFIPTYNWFELYGALSFEPYFLEPTLELYFHPITGLYSTLSLSYSYGFGKNLGLNADFLTGFRSLSQYDDEGWREVGIRLSMPFSFRGVEYTPGFNYMEFPAEKTRRIFGSLTITLP